MAVEYHNSGSRSEKETRMMIENTTKSKLLVLVPDDGFDEAKFAHKARGLAELLHLDIVFIGKIHSLETESLLRRKLVTLSGIAATDSLKSRFIEHDNSGWLEIVSIEYKIGDYILCPQELDDSISHFNPALSLSNRYGKKVFLERGIIDPPVHQKIEQALIQILNVSGILVIMGAAFAIEVGIDGQTFGSLRIIAEIIVVSIEIALLWFWFRLFQKTDY
jgi:hypothetical protein